MTDQLVEPDLAKTIGQTISDSSSWRPDLLGGGCPNAVVVVLDDDVRFPQLGCYESIDDLAHMERQKST